MRRITFLVSEHFHERLRREASQAGISVPELIRLKLQRTTNRRGKKTASYDPLLKVDGVCRGPVLSREIDDALYGH